MPVDVDAVVYWTVWDVEKTALEVQEYQITIEQIAQTGLRDTNCAHCFLESWDKNSLY